MKKYLPITIDKFKEYGVKSLRGFWSKAKKDGYAGLEYDIYSKASSVNKEKYTVDFVMSTEDQDRHTDIVRQNWDLKNFKKNPVFINSHNYNDATEVIGKFIKIKQNKKDKQLEGTVQFAVEENPKAKIIFDLYAEGFLNAVSVGFIPLEFGKSTEFGYEVLKSELLETSAVSVPANAMALAKSLTKLYELDRPNTKNKKSKKSTTKRKSDSNETKRKEDKTETVVKNNGDDKPETKAREEVKDKKTVILNKIYEAVKIVSENTKVETLQVGVKADSLRVINRTVRELLKVKNNIK